MPACSESMEGAFPRHREAVEEVWNANAAFWDATMEEGNDFVNVLCWPAISQLLGLKPGQRILDIACGNGLTSRRLGRSGSKVVAFDVAREMIRLAERRTSQSDGEIRYLTLDANDREGLLSLGRGNFDSAICNMALFDMAEVTPLFCSLYELLKQGGRFVFSVVHPCFNQAHATRYSEEQYREGDLVTTYGIRVTGYMTPTVREGLAIRGQPAPQLYFHRPLHLLLKAGFDSGFILDGVEERAFPSSHRPGGQALGWGPNFSEFPPVIVFRMRRP